MIISVDTLELLSDELEGLGELEELESLDEEYSWQRDYLNSWEQSLSPLLHLCIWFRLVMRTIETVAQLLEIPELLLI